MSFEWPKIHKWEENIERQVTDAAFEYICEFYQVEDVENLTEEQIDEIIKFKDEQLNEYSVLQWGLSNAVTHWENMQEDEEVSD